ncbi:MAG: NAD-dependent epimerase/dehydratase family protein, partial [Acidobacteriota bacterium]
MAPGRLALPDVTIVTGAAGWLGTGLVSAFVDGSHERAGRLRLLVRDQAEAAHVRRVTGDRPVDVVIGDVSAREDVDRLFHGADDADGAVDVIHTAGVIHPAAIDEFDAVNHRGTVNVLAAAERAGVRRMVHVSSNSPFGTNASRADTFRNDEPYHPYLGYGESKMLAELAVLDAAERGLNVVMVRPPWFYGPHQPARQTT